LSNKTPELKNADMKTYDLFIHDERPLPPFRSSCLLCASHDINRSFKRISLTKKEALIKSLIWRIAMILQGFIVAYYFIENWGTALELTIVMNILATIFYYLFDLFWFNRISSSFSSQKRPPEKISF